MPAKAVHDRILLRPLKLYNFLKEDRQWARALRIAHAKQQLSIAQADKDKQFWQQVLEINGGGA